jgi:peptidoglycan/xylan/chitin deacetylase (PgdA/CDA1 family)
LKTLKTIGRLFEFISARDIEGFYYENRTLKNCVHICFDDGDKSIFHNAFPILKAEKIPATLFVSPKIIKNGENYWFQKLASVDEEVIKKKVSVLINSDYEGIKNFSKLAILKSLSMDCILKLIEQTEPGADRKFNMTESQLMEMHNSQLIEIGAHSINHPILKNENLAGAEREISDSIKILAGMINSKVRYFAFPNGIYDLDYDDRELKILENNGMRLAFTSNTGSFSRKNDPLCIPRIGLSRGGVIIVAGKILAAAKWERIKAISSKNGSEEQQRKKIKAMGIFDKKIALAGK